MEVPFIDLKAQYRVLKKEVNEALEKILERTSFALGEEVFSFESEFARYCGVKYAIGVNSGTSALLLALLAAGIGEGDEVITVPNTFVATCEAIVFAGAKPVFVDIDPLTYNMDISKVEEAINERTRAIVPVHLYGQPVDMDPLREIALRYGLLVIEDACQAHGARYKGIRVGSLGDCGCFSFYPSKNLGAYGEGGLATTNNLDLARKIRMLRDHGSERKYYHELIGLNCRMEGFQGAVLRVKMKYLEEWNWRRREHAHLYSQLLSSLEDIALPHEPDFAESVYHLYVVRVKERDDLKTFLEKNKIHTGIHYPIPIHLQNAFGYLGYKKGDFPVAEEYSRKILSLPIYPEMKEEQIIYVVRKIEEFLGR